MKGLQPLFLGIFGIFAFSWLGMMPATIASCAGWKFIGPRCSQLRAP